MPKQYRPTTIEDTGGKIPIPASTRFGEIYCSLLGETQPLSVDDFAEDVEYIIKREAEGIQFTDEQLGELARRDSEFDFQMGKLATAESIEKKRKNLLEALSKAQSDALYYGKPYRFNLEDHLMEYLKGKETMPGDAAPAIALLLEKNNISIGEARVLLAESFTNEIKFQERIKNRNTEYYQARRQILAPDDKEIAEGNARAQESEDIIMECKILREAILGDKRHFPNTNHHNNPHLSGYHA